MVAPLGGVGERPAALPARCTRVYVNGWRVHHGPVGVLLALAGCAARRPWLLLAGVLVTLDDWHDRPWKP